VGEAGLLGVLALVVILTALLPPILRGRSIAARWALLAFAVACVGANPTVFVDLMSLAIAWAAYSLPREVHQGKSVDGRAGPARVASYAAAAIVGAAYVAMLIAGFTYEGARMAVENGDLTEARSALDLSVTLDPSMALYWRQRGELSYVAKLPSAADADLRRAAELNPSDDLAWRALALASAAAGDGDEAGLALAEALKVQRSDVTNLLTRAQWLVRHDRVPEARELLAEVVQSWPSIVAAPGWNELLPPSVSTAQIIDQATRRWELGLNTPEIASDQGLWLAVLGNRPDIDQRAVDEATMGPTLAKSELALLRCQSPGSLLNQATDAERRTLSYWTLRIRVASLDRHQDEAANQIYGIMVGDPGFLDRGDDMLNPLNDAPVMDLWGYRRWPIRWPEVGAALPSPDSGWVTWLLHPREAVRTAGLADRLPACN
jgi:tetratricopeptide (TPR) repeat protein